MNDEGWKMRVASENRATQKFENAVFKPKIYAGPTQVKSHRKGYFTMPRNE